MASQTFGFLRSVPRARARARMLALAPSAGIEFLEERTLLSASLALFNGNYTGSYKGTSTENNNGKITKTAVTATALQATITNGVITATTPAGSGTGTVESNRSIIGTVSTQINGATVPVTFVGKVTAVQTAGISASGTWSYSASLGNGVTVSGSGSWSATAPPALSDYNGNYVGSYKGKDVTNNNGTKTTSTVSPTAFTAVINNGTISVTFPASTGLTAGPTTIDVTGKINGTTTYVENGVTITVTSQGTSTRNLSGVSASGTWSYSVNFGGGVTETGSGTWTLHSVLVFDGAYTGNFSGTTVENNNGTITTGTIPGSALTDNSLQMTIANGVVTMNDPGVPASGTGTIDENGNIVGTVTFLEAGATITVSFTGTAVQTPYGSIITGTWTFSHDYGDGVTYSGQGTWSAENPTATV